MNGFSEVKILMFGTYTKIETIDTSIIIENTVIEKITIKKEDNIKPIILVESKRK